MDYSDFCDFCREGEGFFKTRNLTLYIPEKDSSNTYPPSFGAAWKYRHLKMLDYIKMCAPKRIFEVACGSGRLASILHSMGFGDIVINEARLWPELAKRVEQWRKYKNKPELIQGNFFDLDPAGFEKFDLAIASEIIEHVAHPHEFIERLKGFIKTGGHILITTPNYEYFTSPIRSFASVKDWETLESGQFKPDADGHLYLFSRMSIEHFLKEHNMIVEKAELFSTLFIAGQRDILSFFRSRYTTRTLFLLDKLISRGLFGSFLAGKLCTELIVVARKG